MPITRTFQMDGCENCCQEYCGSYQCRTRDGPAATLCGNPEFSDPSVPPKLYRRTDVEGYWGACDWGIDTCTGNTQAKDKMEYVGSCIYDVDDCSVDNTLARNYGFQFNSPCSDPTLSPNSTMDCDRAYNPQTGTYGDYLTVANVSSSKVELIWNYAGGQLGPCANIAPTLWRTWRGEVKWSLSDEDTIFDAIARETPNAWTAYGTCSEEGTTYVAQRDAEVYESLWREGQIRVTCDSLSIGQAYQITIKTQKRLTDSTDTWVAGPSVTANFTATATSETISDIDLPMIDQYEIRVSQVLIQSL